MPDVVVETVEGREVHPRGFKRSLKNACYLCRPDLDRFLCFRVFAGLAVTPALQNLRSLSVEELDPLGRCHRAERSHAEWVDHLLFLRVRAQLRPIISPAADQVNPASQHPTGTSRRCPGRLTIM